MQHYFTGSGLQLVAISYQGILRTTDMLLFGQRTPCHSGLCGVWEDSKLGRYYLPGSGYILYFIYRNVSRLQIQQCGSDESVVRGDTYSTYVCRGKKKKKVEPCIL